MKIRYREGNPIAKVEVHGTEGKKEYEAYLDTGAGRTLIPETDARELGLEYVGDTTIITDSGKDAIKLFRAKVSFLGKVFKTSLFGRDLPKQSQVNARIGRDIMDKFRVCFHGSNRQIEIE